MTHLSPAEFVDYAEDRLEPRRAAHVDACPACAGRAGEVRSALHAAGDVEIPGPSPLFWDHFAARVSAAVRESGAPRQHWWRQPVFASACALVLVAAVVGGVSLARYHDRSAAAALPAAQSSASADALGSDDPAWDFLTDMAADLPPDDVHAAGFTVRPAAVDRALGDLSAAERQELERLLRDELKRTGA